MFVARDADSVLGVISEPSVGPLLWDILDENFRQLAHDYGWRVPLSRNEKLSFL
jgi:hypothetical protein